MWLSSIIGPILVLGSSGSPTFHSWLTFSMRASKSSLSRAMHNEPRPGTAVLTHVPEHTVDHLGRDVIEIAGVLQHHLRVLATQFQHDPFEIRLGRILEQLPSDVGGAGKGHGIDIHVFAEGRADRRTRCRSRH